MTMGGFVVNDDNDRVHTKREGARDPSPKESGGIPVDTASSSRFDSRGDPSLLLLFRVQREPH